VWNIEQTPLWSLTLEQFDHVAIGLTHNFGATLALKGSSIVCNLESGQIITVGKGHALTVIGLWDTINMMEQLR